MPVRLVIAVTDDGWFEFLRERSYLPEINFWSPSGTTFRALEPGELFLFKLHAPRNYIVGGGVFAHATIMPCSLAWSTFGEANGASTLSEMRQHIAKYRRISPLSQDDFPIGCRILTQPFFLDDSEWLPVPSTWAPNIVTFKTYQLDDSEARALWEILQERTNRSEKYFGLAEPPVRYGEPQLIQPRLGQGAFRIVITDIYKRRCAISGERTLPALEAAHIRPYANGGEHSPRNGVLLRSDIHRLFDAGYVTITPTFRFEVSRRVKEEFENGREYYRFHGTPMRIPDGNNLQPDRLFLEWHNGYVFKG